MRTKRFPSTREIPARLPGLGNCHRSLGRLLGAAMLLLALSPLYGQERTATGITEPILDVTVGAQVAGIVAKLNFKEGEFVEKGEVILELEKELEELVARRRELVLEPLRKDFEDTQFLFKRPNSGTSEDEVVKAKLDYELAVVDHQLAQADLRRRLVVAPISGIVTEIYLEIGEACQAQQPLARLVDTRRCYFTSNIDAKTGHSLRIDQPVELQVNSGSASAKLGGTITYVSPVVDPASGLMRVRAVFENPGQVIRPGVAGAIRWEEGGYGR